MDTKYACMHDCHGYFVGQLIMGYVRRISLEYFPDAKACLQAIRNHHWTRRTAH